VAVGLPPSPEALRDLELLLLAHHPLLSVESVEEDRLRALLAHVCERQRMPFFVWSPTDGLERQAPESGRPHGTETPERCLAFNEAANLEAVFFLPGLTELDDPKLIARL
jgi:hypothetical protein